MKYQNGLRVYAVIQVKKYDGWNILVTDLKEYPPSENYPDGFETLCGMAFDENNELDSMVELLLPVEFTEIGYVYAPYCNPKLTLSFSK